jgi:hypothetical protein
LERLPDLAKVAGALDAVRRLARPLRYHGVCDRQQRREEDEHDDVAQREPAA